MRRVGSLLRNINVLNIILFVVAIMLANYVVFPFLNMEVKYVPAIPKKLSNQKEEKPAQSPTSNPTDYAIIADQNLFHPDRKIPPEKTEEVALPKPEFVLYGTLITDNMRFAFLEDRKSPRSTPGRGKRQTALKQGDTMSGYTLKEIDHDKVVMAKGEETLIVKVIDSSVKKDREAVSTPVASSTPPIPGTRVQPVPGAQPQRPSPQPPTPAQAVKPRRSPYRTLPQSQPE